MQKNLVHMQTHYMTISFQAEKKQQTNKETKDRVEKQTNMNGSKGHQYSFCAVTQGETGDYMPRELFHPMSPVSTLSENGQSTNQVSIINFRLLD